MAQLEYTDDRPRAGGKSQFLLQLINGFSLFIALCMVGVSCWGLAAWNNAPDGSWENVPTWAFYGAIAFGTFVGIVSVLGCVGAKKRNKCALVIYIVIVFLALIVQIAVAVYALGYYNYLGDAKDSENWQKVDSNVQKYIVDGFVEFAEKAPAKWVDLQDYNTCCGYNLHEAYANDCDGATFRAEPVVSTGEACAPFRTVGNAFCTEVAAATAAATKAELKQAYKKYETDLAPLEFCQKKLLEETEKYSMGLGITALVMVVSTFVALVASSRLACCVTSRDGGYAEEFGYGGQQQGQQTTGGALTGTAGVNYA